MALPRQQNVRAPDWRVSYAGVNVTALIQGMATEITYEDDSHGVSGDVTIKVEDSNRRFQGPWFPVLGDLLELTIGYAGEPKLFAGHFQVDQCDLDGPPDVFTMKLMPTFITPAMRTPTSFAFENVTLVQVANTIASKYGMTVVSAPVGVTVEIPRATIYQRITQNRETDLAFLKRIAEDNSFDFTVRGKVIQFYPRVLTFAAKPVATIDRTGCEKFRFTAQSRMIFKGAEVAYQDPATGTLISGSADKAVPAPMMAGAKPTAWPADKLRVVRRVESPEDATAKATAALRLHNSLFASATLTIPGNILMVSLNNVTVTGFGAFDSTYSIKKVRHTLHRDTGYTTEVDLQQIPN